jgi:Fe-S oxidoreductase
MLFDWFVLPFTIGMVFVLGYTIAKFISWVHQLESADKKAFFIHLFSKDIFISIKEIFNESLLHRRIFKVNKKLGFMHMSLAFGWFLLIALGNIEIKFYAEYAINPPYVPIFLRFFEPDPAPHFFGRGANFLMDLLLLMILVAVGLAIYKRFRPGFFGMKKTTVLHVPDKIALYALWCIFPLRFIAESFTSGIYNNGSFLTGSAGSFFAAFLPVENLYYPAWWAYSFALGAFFLFLPFSRYMHILAEMMLIVMRNAGVKACIKNDVYHQAQILSCSRCGVCIDKCQLSKVNDFAIQPSYFIREVRYNKLKEETAENCLMCGRCDSICPVGVESKDIRLRKRAEAHNTSAMDYEKLTPANHHHKSIDVLYFAGCMSHLTPSIKASMKKILKASGEKWQMLDENATICCGRPLQLNGQLEAAQKLRDKNAEMIRQSGAKILVTSCPICFKTFKDDYHLDIQVVHHSQYIASLLDKGLLHIEQTDGQFSYYHHPCELGRNSGVYEEPYHVLHHTTNLIKSEYSRQNSLCCGGSIANTKLELGLKVQVAKNAIDAMELQSANQLVTACPLCKKTFDRVSPVPVKDIAEVVVNAMELKRAKKKATEKAEAVHV